MAVLLRSLKAEFRRPLSRQHKQKISQALRGRGRGRKNVRANTKLIPFDSREHRVAYNQIGGRAVAQDIASKNSRMDLRTADNYTREYARAYTLSAIGEQERGQQELDRVNRKYDRYFG